MEHYVLATVPSGAAPGTQFLVRVGDSNLQVTVPAGVLPGRIDDAAALAGACDGI